MPEINCEFVLKVKVGNMLKCKEVVKVVSSDQPISLKQKIEIKMHLMMCRHCRRYQQQLNLLKNGFVRLLKLKYNSADPQKIDQIENKVLDKVNKRSNQ